jgi:glycosyltransferase involved in cell wall biosynthesis
LPDSNNLMYYFALILFLMQVLRTSVVHLNRISKVWIPESKQTKGPKVSILIPARNEAHNLPRLLDNLMELNYTNLEIIICDDHSEDQTPEILRNYAQRMSNLSHFVANELPSGWSGKNHACYQLAQRGTGEYFLFVDADVILKPYSVTSALGFALDQGTSLLSVFPEQVIQSKGEWQSVPLMNRILLSFLPLALVSWKLFPSLSAANGQFMLFKAEDYRREQWHEQVKNQAVEDIQIARLIKQKKLNLAVKLGDNDIFCRMYQDRVEAIAGFSRNIHQYFGGSRIWLSFFVIITWIRIPLLILAGFPVLAQISFLLIFTNIYHISVMSKQSIYTNFIYSLSQQLVLTEIWLVNLRARYKGWSEWKGRKINS